VAGAVARERLKLEPSLYILMQAISVTEFEKIDIRTAVSVQDCRCCPE
jgi:hypothetical protein